MKVEDWQTLEIFLVKIEMAVKSDAEELDMVSQNNECYQHSWWK